MATSMASGVSFAAARGWDGLHQSRFPAVHALHGPPQIL
jgi:hypothetical protein